MSREHRTRATVYEDDWIAVRERAYQASVLEARLPQLIASARRQARTELETRLRPMEDHQQRLESRMSGVDAGLADLTRRTGEEIRRARRDAEAGLEQAMQEAANQADRAVEVARRETASAVASEREDRRREAERQRQEVQARLDAERRERQEALARQRAELQGAIERQGEVLRAEIESERKTRTEEVARIKRQIGDLQERTARLERLDHAQRHRAGILLKAAEELAASIRSDFAGDHDHERFRPGALATAVEEAARGAANLASAPQAAIVQAENAFQSLTTLDGQLQIDVAEFERATEEVQLATRVLAAAIESSRVVGAIGMDGTPWIDVATNAPYEVDVDWWTEGELTNLRQRLQQIEDQIATNRTRLSTAELRKLSEHVAVDLREQLRAITTAAREGFIGSTLRSEAVLDMADALKAEGFDLLPDHGFVDGDERRGYVASVKRVDGAEVDLTANPERGGPLSIEVGVDNKDAAERTEAELLAREELAGAALRGADLQADNPWGPLAGVEAAPSSASVSPATIASA
jgi:hypothetical protein